MWNAAQENEVKAELTRPTVLALYSPQAAADASSYGLGAVLLQEHEGVWKPVSYASRSMSDTERRHAQIEKEALATTWACEKLSWVLNSKSKMIIYHLSHCWGRKTWTAYHHEF